MSWNLSEEVWAAIIGGALGSALSGFIAVLLQWQAHRHADRVQAKRDRDDDLADGHELLMAMQACYSSARHYAGMIQEAQERLETSETYGQLWPALLPLVNFPSPLELSASNYAVLLKHRRSAAFNRVRDAVSVHNSIRDAWQHYSAIRTSLSEQFTPETPVVGKDSGFKGTAVLSGEKMAALSPQISQVESLATILAGRAGEDQAAARQALADVIDLFAEEFNEVLKLEFSDADDLRAG